MIYRPASLARQWAIRKPQYARGLVFTESILQLEPVLKVACNNMLSHSPPEPATAKRRTKR